MYCSACGQEVREEANFCEQCGAQLRQDSQSVPQTAQGSEAVEPVVASRGRRGNRGSDPYKEQIAELKLVIKQMKLDLKHVNTRMANTRAQYHETAAFVPHGILHKGYKMFENMKLLGSQQDKQRLQKEIMDLEQELLNLQQAQLAWKEEQGVL